MRYYNFLLTFLLVLLLATGVSAFSGTSSSYDASFEIQSISIKDSNGNYNVTTNSIFSTGNASSINYDHNFLISSFTSDAHPPSINITTDISPIVISPTNLLTINFTSKNSASCYYRQSQSSLSKPTDCQVSYCTDERCVYACSSGSGGGGGSSYISLGSGINFSITLNASQSNKYTYDFMCNNSAGSDEVSTVPFVVRQNNITLEWVNIPRKTLATNQSFNIEVSVTSVNELLETNNTLWNDSGLVAILGSNGFNSTSVNSIDKRFSFVYDGRNIEDNFYFKAVLADGVSPEVWAEENFTIYRYKSHNLSISSGSGGSSGSNISVSYLNDNNETVFATNKSTQVNKSARLPAINLTAEVSVEDRFKVQIPIKDNINNTVVKAKNLSVVNLSDSNLQLGNTSRYAPLDRFAFELENVSSYNSSHFKVKFEYDDSVVTDPTKLTIMKSFYNWTNNQTNFNETIMYSYGDSENPLYVNENETYVYFFIDSFSDFIMSEDKATSEICGNGIDDDFDGSVDEGCTSGGSSGGSSSGSSSAPASKILITETLRNVSFVAGADKTFYLNDTEVVGTYDTASNTLLIGSNSFDIVLNTEYFIDINKNNVYDLSVEIVRISGNSLIVSLKTVSIAVPQHNSAEDSVIVENNSEMEKFLVENNSDSSDETSSSDKTSSTDFTLPIVIFSLLLLILIMVLFFKFKRKSKPSSIFSNLPEVRNYVKKARDRGYSDSEIVSKLKEHGWKDEQIKDVFN